VESKDYQAIVWSLNDMRMHDIHNPLQATDLGSDPKVSTLLVVKPYKAPDSPMALFKEVAPKG
jgi:hypothetical protein